MRDININASYTNQSSHATNYINAAKCNEAFHLITKFTRVTDNSLTIADHIITNDAMHTIHPSFFKKKSFVHV